MTDIKAILDARSQEAAAAMTELLGEAPTPADMTEAVEVMNARFRPPLPASARPPGDFVPKVKLGTIDASVDRSVCTESEIEFLDAEPE